jgi:hypothetical protein
MVANCGFPFKVTLLAGQRSVSSPGDSNNLVYPYGVRFDGADSCCLGWHWLEDRDCVILVCHAPLVRSELSFLRCY